MSEQVPNIVQFKASYKQIVHQLVQIRKQAGQTQDNMAEWIGVDRRKIISFENLKKVDLEVMLIYANNLSVDITLDYKVY
jgi:DNA-binding XRE family transcriptional regulator